MSTLGVSEVFLSTHLRAILQASHLQQVLLLALLCASLYFLLQYGRFRARRYPLPPGPAGIAILGNVHQLPSRDEHVTFANWARQYGDVMHVSIFGQPIIFLSSLESATDLLEKRSSIYSDRHQYTMINDLVGWGKALVFLPFSDRFKKSRRLLQSSLNHRLLAQYKDYQEAEAYRYLAALLDTPDDFEGHIRQNVGSVIAKVSYGYQTQPRKDPLLRVAHDALEHLSASGPPGKFLVDFIPYLRFVPSWFPGANFQRLAMRWKKDTYDMVNLPWARVKFEFSEGEAKPSLAANLLQALGDKYDDLEEDISKWAVASLFGAGSDTTVSSILTFILCIVLNPGVQTKAQKEIDSVCGPDRLPGFGDRSSLPYVDAVIKEVLRWHPSVKLVPHRLMKDDVYRNFNLPEGSQMILNTWAIARDEKHYPEPDSFNPDRFMPPLSTSLDPRSYVFGFGRRVCPGLALADSAIYISVVTMLASFNISKYKDARGLEIPPVINYESGVLSRPRPFRCTIKPRSDQAIKLIMASLSARDE